MAGGNNFNMSMSNGRQCASGGNMHVKREHGCVLGYVWSVKSHDQCPVRGGVSELFGVEQCPAIEHVINACPHYLIEDKTAN